VLTDKAQLFILGPILALIFKGVVLFVYAKVDNFWDNPIFSFATKKVRGGDRE
jgi:hypothetical protein